MTEELLYLIWLTCNTSFSPSLKKYLSKYSAEQIYRSDYNTLISLGFGERLSHALSDKSLERAKTVLRICRYKGIVPVAYTDDEYPYCICDVSDMPIILYMRGDPSVLERGIRVGFVGTRFMTDKGESFAVHVANELVANGALIISGGASGIDSVGLTSSFYKGKPAVAVLGCDIDKYYPSKNYALLEHTAKNGLVISEYPPQTNARFFPTRNRIIAGLSQRLAVLEAPLGSGALITAQYASDYGVPVFAPYADGDSFAGCRDLVDRGAYELTDGVCMLRECYSVELKKSRKKTKPSTKITAEVKPCDTAVKHYDDSILEYVADSIRRGLDTPDKMADSAHPIQLLLRALTQLELEGDIEALPGNRYVIK